MTLTAGPLPARGTHREGESQSYFLAVGVALVSVLDAVVPDALTLVAWLVAFTVALAGVAATGVVLAAAAGATLGVAAGTGAAVWSAAKLAVPARRATAARAEYTVFIMVVLHFFCRRFIPSTP